MPSAAPPPACRCAFPRSPARGAGECRAGSRPGRRGRRGEEWRSYAGARAQVVDDALLALRAPGNAHAPAVVDHEMAEAVPLALGNQLHQVALDLHGILLARELEP